MNSTFITAMEQFCGGPFFELEQVWGKDVRMPRFSECFMHTILIWIPVFVLLLLTPLQCFDLRKSKRQLSLPWRGLLIAKLATYLLLEAAIITSLVRSATTNRYSNDTGQQQQQNASGGTVEILAQGLLLLCTTILFVFALCCRYRGLVTSATISISLLALAICGIPEFAARIQDLSFPSTGFAQNSGYDSMLIICYFVYYALIILLLLLNCFADKRANYEAVGKQKQCPEYETSFFSQITYSWLNGLCVRGWRRPLTNDDMWSLNDVDASEWLVQKWQAHWTKRVRAYWKRVEEHKAKLEEQHGDERDTTNVELMTVDGFTNNNNINKGKYNLQQRHATLHQRNSCSNSNKSKKCKTPDPPSVVYCLYLSMKWIFVHATVMKFAADILQFLNPMILQLLLAFIVSEDEPLWKGYLYTFGLFATALVCSVLNQSYMHGNMRIGMNLRTMLTSAAYQKVLNLSCSARRRFTAGEIVNLMSVDIQRFMDVTQFLNFLWSSPLTIVLAIYFLYQQLGPAVFAGLAVMIILVPLNYIIVLRLRRLQVAQMKLKDDRMKLVNEILNGIKVIKFYAWEESYEKKTLDIRSRELAVLISAAYHSAFTVFSWTCAPVLVTVASFACFVYLDPVNNILTPERAFVSLALFNILRMPLIVMPMVVSFLVQASVSNKRLKDFLVSEETDPDMVTRNAEQEESILVENATFTWDKESSRHCLEDINLRVKPGQLVAVVGQVGAGKSSLLSAILGEMDKVKGYVGTKGSIAYVPQQAWIQNMTLRENVTFSRPFDKSAYDRVIDACALRTDLAILPGGDDTEIGEKGVNLSGGQKQRVSLARAVYQKADVYLFDDPLSAVDAHVGSHIFKWVVSNDGMLKGKTRILVTHGLGYLKNVDQIIVLREGRISEVGSYEQLMAQKGAFADLIDNYLDQKVEDVDEIGPSSTNNAILEEALEEVTRSRLNSDVSRRESIASSVRYQDGVLSMLRAISQISSCDQLSDVDIIEESSNSKRQKAAKLADAVRRAKSLLGGNSSSTSAAAGISPRSLSTGTSKMSKKISKETAYPNGENEERNEEDKSKLIQVEKSSVGQVKWKVYKDYLEAVGWWTVAGILVLYAASNAFTIGSSIWLSDWSDDSLRNDSQSSDVRVSVFAALGVAQALFTLSGTLLLTYGMVSAGAYLHKRLLQNLLRSPMSFYDVTPLGRIINRIGKDIDIIDNILQQNFRTWLITLTGVIATLIVILIGLPVFALVILPLGALYYLIQRFYISTSRQLKRLESISRSPLLSHFQETVTGSIVIRAFQATARFAEESQRRVDFNHRSYWPNMASMRWLGFRLDMIGNLIVVAAAVFAVLSKQWDAAGSTAGMIGVAISYALSITIALNLSVRMASDLESNVVAVERVKEYCETPTEAEWRTKTRPSSGWPQSGSVQFEDYKLRYRPGLDLVLRGISCRVKGGEKIGIVGRTGAGKSSLTQALFRIVEAAGGRISIDGMDISTIGLHDLRACLTIIPQEPVLFCGNLRMNLDPFDTYSDEQIWDALEHAHLKEFVAQAPSKLMYPIAEGGENLSVGQRQLLCLARALLKKTKVLILDEATAAVDLETDDLIQKTIRAHFGDCTILTIAHRLNTVMDSDRVMVLSKGEIHEMAEPEQLLKNKDSMFYSMAKEAQII